MIMKHMLETLYGPGYFENLKGLKEDIRSIKFVMYRTFSDKFQNLFDEYYHVFGTPYYFLIQRKFYFFMFGLWVYEYRC